MRTMVERAEQRAWVREHRDLVTKRMTAERAVKIARSTLIAAAAVASATCPQLVVPVAEYAEAVRRLEEISARWQTGRFKR